MKRKLLLVITFLFVFLSFLNSCKITNGSNANNDNNDNNEDLFYSSENEVKIIFSTEAQKDAANTISSEIISALGVSSSVCSQESSSSGREIVIGRCERTVSKDAYALLERKIDRAECDSGYLIYSDGESIAVAYEGRAEQKLLSAVVDCFVDNFVFEELELFSGATHVNVFDLLEYLEADDEALASASWAAFAGEYGEDLTVALRQLYSCYDDNIVDWLANLYDADIGGFYFSNSARNYNGLLPDLESTVQALGFLVNSGMAKSYDGSQSYADAIPEEMAEQIIGFVKGLQNSNGYFYHPQWGQQLTDSRLSRRGRDLTWATNILSEFGVSPIYDTPNGMKGSGVETVARMTTSLSASKATSVSKVIFASSEYIPEHLLNKNNFENYLSSLKLTTDSYTVGNELSSQISQIVQRDKALSGKGYSLVDILISWLNDNQNPATGTWDYLNPGDANYSVYRGMDGLFKILTIYNTVGAELPHAKEAIESTKYCIDVDIEANIVCDVYNTWYTLDMIFENLNKYSADRASGRALAAEELEKLRDEAPTLVNASTKKILKFVQPDGAFEFQLDDGKSYESQGVPVSVPGIEESNVNATVICTSGLVGYIYAALDISDFDIPIFGASDMQRFLDIIGDLSPVIKEELTYATEYVDFEADDLGKPSEDVIIKKMSDGSIKVVERDRGRALSIDSKKGGGDSVEVEAGKGLISPKCFVFEADICVNYADRQGRLGEISLLDKGQNAIYLLYIENRDGKIVLSDCSSTLADKRVIVELGEFGSIGSWFNLKVEYYVGDHESFRAKIYLNDKLVAVSDNYYDKNGLKFEGGVGTPINTYYSTRISVFSYVEAEFIVDNLASYYTKTPYEIPAVSSSLRVQVDYDDLGEKKYDFDNGTLDDIVADLNASIVDEVLNISGSAEVAIPLNIRATKANCVTFESDITINKISGNARAVLTFVENLNTKAALSSIALKVRADGTKTVIDLYDMPNGRHGSLLCTIESDENGVAKLKIDYYDSMGATLIYLDGKLVAMTNGIYEGAKLKSCYAVTLSTESGIEIGVDNLVAEKKISSYLDAIRPENDEVIYDFSYSDPQINTSGQIGSGVLTLGADGYLRLPINRRGVVSNMVCFEGSIKIIDHTTDSGYRITLLDKDGNKLVEYVAVKNGSKLDIYESTVGTEELRAFIGSYDIADTAKLKFEFYFREETANIYINDVLLGISSSVYNSTVELAEPSSLELSVVGSAVISLDDVKAELNYKVFEKETQKFGDTTDSSVMEFEGATSGNLPERVSSNLKSATASLRIKSLYCKDKFTNVLQFATGAGENDKLTLTSYGGDDADNCQRLSLTARMSATAPWDTFGVYAGSTSEYAYTFALSVAYGDVYLTFSSSDSSAASLQTMRYTIATEGEWFDLDIEYYYVGDAKGTVKLYVNDLFVAELKNIVGTRHDNLTYADFASLTFYSYSSTDAVIYLDDVDVTTAFVEYESGGESKFDTVDFESYELTDDGTLDAYGKYVKINHPVALSDGTIATFADITADPEDAVNKVLRIYSTRKSGGSGDGYPSSAMSVEIALTGTNRSGYCYVFETKIYISSNSYMKDGTVANIDLNFGGSEKATSIAVKLKTDSDDKKQAYLTSVYGTDKTTALYTFDCDSWITLRFEFYRGKYATDNYGTIIYANGVEVARDLAWRTGLSNYQTREFAATKIFLDRYMAGCVLIDDASVYISEKTYE